MDYWHVRLAVGITARLPRMIIREPEQVLLAYYALLMGIVIFVPYFNEFAVGVELGTWSGAVWGLTYFLGGLALLTGLGITTNTRTRQPIKVIAYGRLMERTGYSLIGTASLTYAAVVLVVNGAPATIRALLFIGIALDAAVRLVVSTTGRAVTLSRGLG